MAFLEQSPAAGSESGDRPLSRVTLGDQIAERLRRDILFGLVGPDERITQESLTGRFATSRIPVRDAIQRLLHEGFLRNTPNGVRAVALTQQDLDDMFLIEAQLHSVAARLMVARASDEEVEDLVAINAEMRSAFESGAYEQVADANRRFHRRINRLAKSPRLLASLRTVATHVEHEYLVHFPQRTAAAINEHDEFLEAVRHRDADASAELMARHVAQTSQQISADRDARDRQQAQAIE